MRGSPISNIRGRTDYSPYESNPRTAHQHSPPRHNYPSSNEADYWKTKARQIEAELIAVNEQLVFQIRKNEKIDDLEDKIELLLAQNNHFVDENQKLIQLVQQKNEQIDMWKRKFQSEFDHSHLAETEKKKVYDNLNIRDQEHQIQIEKLLSEVTRLQNDLVEADNLKKLEIHRLKNQYESESIAQIQNLRRSQNGNNEIQELNIRKLKDTIEEKNFEVEDLARQLRLKNQELKAEASYSRNELKKMEEQKSHEMDLVKAEQENAKNNLQRAHRKNEDELRNLHEAKVKRLLYQIQEKKHEIEQTNNRVKRSGKEGEAEIARLIKDNGVLRNQLKENDNHNRNRIEQLTAFYQNQFARERETSQTRQDNQRQFYEHQIEILNHLIASKEEEIRRLLQINKELKRNEEERLHQVRENNEELKEKLEEVVKHYEREVELMKIKVAHLYEADLESLKSKMQNSYSNHATEAEELRKLLKETRERLAHQVQDRLDQRKEYELRLTEFSLSHDRIQKELKNMVTMRDKELEGHTSKASLTHIGHNQMLEDRHLREKQIMAQKRNLENKINYKNKEIQTLNLKVQEMMGLHKRDLEKAEKQLEEAKDEYNKWLQRQEQETSDWHFERDELNKKIEDLKRKQQQLKNQAQARENELTEENNNKGIENARLQGLVEELERKVGNLHSSNQIEAGNVQKTILETRTLMNTEKEKLLETVSKQKNLSQQQIDRMKCQLDAQITDLNKENDALRDNYNKSQIREEELKQDVRGLTHSVNQRSKLEESVIGMGLSNNYFKNVAEIFKRSLK